MFRGIIPVYDVLTIRIHSSVGLERKATNFEVGSSNLSECTKKYTEITQR